MQSELVLIFTYGITYSFTFTFYLYFLQLYYPNGIFPREIRVAFPGESQLRQSRATQPAMHAGCFGVSIIHQTLTGTKESLTCAQMLMYVIVYWDVRTP